MKPTGKSVSVRPIAELAALYGVSVRTVTRWKRDGVDVNSPEAVEAYRATLQDGKAPGGKEAKELKEEKLKAETRLKTAQAERAELLLLETKGNLVGVPEMAELAFAVASQVGAMLSRLEGELPGQLEGLSAADMQPIIREKTDSVRSYLAENLGHRSETLCSPRIDTGAGCEDASD
jgi:phage terminase Nu1 subunit (DNA packaging protein)